MSAEIKKRASIVLTIFIVCLIALITRLAYWQIWRGDELSIQAKQQQTRERTLNSNRGTIYDREGIEIVKSASVFTIYIAPNEIKSIYPLTEEEETEKKIEIFGYTINLDFLKKKETEEPKEPRKMASDVAAMLGEVLDMPSEEILKIISKNSAYEKLKSKVETDISNKVRDLEITGVYIDEDSKRYYPQGNFSSHLLGFTGTDNQGLDGVEKIFESTLKGEKGRIISATNAKGNEMPYKYERYEDPIDGQNIYLTLDEAIQHFTEKHLETALAETNPTLGIACIVMQPKTGEILAMATTPDFDLNQPFEINEIKREEIEKITSEEEINSILSTFSKATIAEIEKIEDPNKRIETIKAEAIKNERFKMWRNKAVVDTYEPGSTFKIITAAAAIEENCIPEGTTFYCNGGLQVESEYIRCWKAGGHGVQTFEEAIANSCNPALIEIGEKIGAETFYKYIKAFGFTAPTGIDLPGEAMGVFFKENAIGPVELATISFGQGFQVTPLQMISAVSAVANGGTLYKPQIVSKFTDSDEKTTKTFPALPVRQVISKSTADKLNPILENVVAEGTGGNAYVKGYRVAGKTGTSEKFPRNQDKYIASFVGFAPADDPQVACLIIIDEPNCYPHTGGAIAAPVVGRIIEDILKHLKVKPSNLDELENVVVPDVNNMPRNDAVNILNETALKYKIQGNGDIIVDQMPKYGATVSKDSTVILYTSVETMLNTVPVPNVLGKSVVEARQILGAADLNTNLTGAALGANELGDTIIKSQYPETDTLVSKGTIIDLEVRKIILND